MTQEGGEAPALYAGRRGAIGIAALIAVASQSFVLLALVLYGKALGVTMSLFAVAAAVPVAQGCWTSTPRPTASNRTSA